MTEKQKIEEEEKDKAEAARKKKEAGPQTHEQKMEAKIAAIKKAKFEAEMHKEDDEIDFLSIDIPVTNLLENIGRTRINYSANY